MTGRRCTTVAEIAAGLNGNSTQMDGGGVPALSLIILVIHIIRAGCSLLGLEEPRDAGARGAAHRRVAAIRPHVGDGTAAGKR